MSRVAISVITFSHVKRTYVCSAESEYMYQIVACQLRMWIGRSTQTGAAKFITYIPALKVILMLNMKLDGSKKQKEVDEFVSCQINASGLIISVTECCQTRHQNHHSDKTHQKHSLPFSS